MRKPQTTAAKPAMSSPTPQARPDPQPTPAAKPAASKTADKPQKTGNNGAPSREAIAMCAYEKWQAAGCPVGDGINFWLEAEQELQSRR